MLFLRSHFWAFTEVVRKIGREVTRKMRKCVKSVTANVIETHEQVGGDFKGGSALKITISAWSARYLRWAVVHQAG